MSKAPFTDFHSSVYQALHPGTCQKVTFSGTSAQSNAMQTRTSAVELYSTKACWIKFGTNPTAVANDGSSFYLDAGLFKVYGIAPGQKIAVIQDAAGGDLHLIEGA